MQCDDMVGLIITNALVLAVCSFISHLEGSLLIKYKAKAINKPKGPFDCISMQYLYRYASVRNKLTGKFKLLYWLNMICLILFVLMLLLLIACVALKINAVGLLEKTHWSIILSPALFGVLGTAYATTVDKSSENINHSKVMLEIFMFEVIIAIITTIIYTSCKGS